jgi:hypothetical protein
MDDLDSQMEKMNTGVALCLSCGNILIIESKCQSIIFRRTCVLTVTEARNTAMYILVSSGKRQLKDRFRQNLSPGVQSLFVREI